MLSGVYDHSVVIADWAVRAMSNFVSTDARSASTGCTIAPTKAPPATNKQAAATAAIRSHLPAGWCGTRIGSSPADSVDSVVSPPVSLSDGSATGSSSLVVSGSLSCLADLPALPTGVRGAVAASAVVGVSSAAPSTATCSVAACSVAACGGRFFLRRRKFHRRRFGCSAASSSAVEEVNSTAEEGSSAVAPSLSSRPGPRPAPL